MSHSSIQRWAKIYRVSPEYLAWLELNDPEYFSELKALMGESETEVKGGNER